MRSPMCCLYCFTPNQTINITLIVISFIRSVCSVFLSQGNNTL
jgi:hypothetical protein